PARRGRAQDLERRHRRPRPRRRRRLLDRRRQPGHPAGSAAVSRRSSAGWMAGVLALLTGLGLAAALVPLRRCATCDDLAKYWTRSTSPAFPPAPFPRLDCPDCADSGRISLLRAWRPRVSQQIGHVLRGLKDPSGKQVTAALQPILQ